MRRFLHGAVVLCALAWAGEVSPTRAEDAGAQVPDATQVVVRGKKHLVDALAVAGQAAWSGRSPRPIAIVVDVTPNTQKHRAWIEAALAALASKAGAVPAWSIAALGEKLSKPVDSPGALVPKLGRVLAKDKEIVSTFTALDKTLSSWKAKDGVAIYLADWRCEDDVDLEKFIGRLQKKGRTLSVVGTEAAWGRGWNDGIRDGSDRLADDVRGWGIADYWQGIGRSPFQTRDKRAPWHGGDTSYPHAPYRWHAFLWQTAFSQTDWELADLEKELDELIPLDTPEKPDGYDAKRDALLSRQLDLEHRLSRLQDELARSEDETERSLLARQVQEAEEALRRLDEEFRALEKERPESDPAPPDPLPPGLPPGLLPRSPEPVDPEDLGKRLPGGGVDDEDLPPFVDPTNKSRRYPLPSTFGPYALARAAGVTGGRYVLWSWNPSGRKSVEYEYPRCNLFPPDLRPRGEIRKSIRKNPFARSMLQAWHHVLEARTEVLEHTPPLKANLSSPCSVDRPQDTVFFISGIWESAGEQKQYVKHAERTAKALARAIEVLDEGIQEGGEPATPVLQRYQADAMVFRHALRVVRFQLTESIQAAALVTRDKWRQRGEHGVIGHTWVGQGRDAAKVRGRESMPPFDPVEGQRILEERRALLARFRGTPFGELIALNEIQTSRPTHWERTDTIPGTGRSPSESVDPPQPVVPMPGGGSGGGGPTTGG